MEKLKVIVNMSGSMEISIDGWKMKNEPESFKIPFDGTASMSNHNIHNNQKEICALLKKLENTLIKDIVNIHKCKICYIYNI